jgi:ATP-dependent DNA helicase RecG
MMNSDSPISDIIRLKDTTKTGLKKLGLHTAMDLLMYFPVRYADSSLYTSISMLKEGDDATIRGTVQNISSKKSWKTKVNMSEAVIEDVSGSIRVIWFHQPYLAKMLHKGKVVELTGKITTHGDKLTLVNPSMRNEKVLPIDNHDSIFAKDEDAKLTPIYAETKGISSEWFRHAIAKVLSAVGEIPDHIPNEILKQYSLPHIKNALVWMHSPKNKKDAEVARKRFAFDEIFSINVARAKERHEIMEKKSYAIDLSSVDIKSFEERFGFPLTDSQKQSIKSILNDLEKEIPMSRLLEGDVGSGKTAVAAVATYATIMNRPGVSGKKQTFGNLQVAYMAPTEILATQHFESFCELFEGSGVSIALITGSGARKYPSKVASNTRGWTEISKAQLKKWIASGEIPIVIGTHALIQKSLEFKHLALAIIDEQHRFGLNQRKGLAKKDSHFPHLLSMTATPIPRTLALTIYGDLDLSLLDQMPAGRKETETKIITPDKRDEVYKKIEKELDAGRQAYVICARIDNTPEPGEEQKLQITSVIQEAERLDREVFPHRNIGILHSKMTKQEKDSVMQDFANHEIDILVATSVVEVGVNIPNATSIIIEGAERFGLAQLHQLRGRVRRSTHQSYCYLFAESKSEKTRERLNMFTKAKNGFELAEYDLQLRGSGELTGGKQWGISDIGMEALRNMRLVEAARNSAKELVERNPSLSEYPLLRVKSELIKDMHFE